MGVMNVFKKKTSEERLEELEAKRKKEEVNIEQYNALENKWWPTIRQNTLFLMEGTFYKIFFNRMEFSFFESPLVARILNLLIYHVIIVGSRITISGKPDVVGCVVA